MKSTITITGIGALAMMGCTPMAQLTGAYDERTLCVYEVLSATPGINSIKINPRPMQYEELDVRSGSKQYFQQIRIDYAFRNQGVVKSYSVLMDNHPPGPPFPPETPLRDLNVGADHPIGRARDALLSRCGIERYSGVLVTGDWEGIQFRAGN